MLEIACLAEAEGEASAAPEERRLWIAWNELPPGTVLTSTAGRLLTLLSPGTWNVGAGPDFLHAELRYDGQTRRGDIEIHRHGRDWQAHGHGGDPRYGRVILHVVWEGGRPGPAGIPCVELRQQRPGLALAPLDAAGYPYGRQVGPGACAAAWAVRSDAEIAALLLAASEKRLDLRIRQLRLEAMVFGEEQALYRRLLDALGFQACREWFRQLSERCPLERLLTLEDDEARLALLCGAGGLLPDPTSARIPAELQELLPRLWRRWWRSGGLVLPLSRPAAPNRPWNAPERRLWAAWEWLRRWEWRPARRFEPLAAMADASLLLEGLDQELQVPGSRFEGFLDFASAAVPAALVGPGRRRDVIANVLLPWLGMRSEAASGVRNPAILEAWRRLPRLQSNRQLEEASHRFFTPPSRARSVLARACHQQGLLLLYREICVPLCRECGKCPGQRGF